MVKCRFRHEASASTCRCAIVGVPAGTPLDSAFVTLAPEDSGWIGSDFIEQLREAWCRWKCLLRVPAQITVLAVQPP